MEKKDRNKWTNKFRALGKKKGSRSDFVNLYKEMKKDKDSKDKNKLPPTNNVYENKDENKLERVIGANFLSVRFMINHL